MQPAHHLPPNVLFMGKRIRVQDYRVGRVQFDAHDTFVGQQTPAAQPFQRRQHAQQFDMPAQFVLAEGDRHGLPLGGKGVEDNRHHVFHGVHGMACGFRFLRGRLGKLLQMCQHVVVQ